MKSRFSLTLEHLFEVLTEIVSHTSKIWTFERWRKWQIIKLVYHAWNFMFKRARPFFFLQRALPWENLKVCGKHLQGQHKAKTRGNWGHGLVYIWQFKWSFMGDSQVILKEVVVLYRRTKKWWFWVVSWVLTIQMELLLNTVRNLKK